MTRVLVVDDEARMAEAIRVALTRAGFECRTAPNGTDGLASFRSDGADVVVTDLRMPGLDGLELMRAIRAVDPGVPVILVTAHGDVASAVAAMKDGAFDYVQKPFDNDELRALVGRAARLRALEQENRALKDALRDRATGVIVAESPAMKALLALVDRAAPSRATVLVTGESGTGKEVVARRLHAASDRAAGPFVAVNCAALAAGVLESELFGHERGAFTGATTTRAGCFERAHGGTLLLDEIGELGGEFQAKLLRVLQEGEVLRVGGTAPRRVDVRVVAATNRDLREEVRAGRFREDLFFRLSVLPVEIPPLRARREDIGPLAEHFLARHAAETGKRHVLSADAAARLAEHDWPGNVRELENALLRACVLARGEQIEPEDLLLEAIRPGAAPSARDAGTLQDALDVAAADRIRAALAATGGKKAEAAAVLGVERTTLYRLMRRLGIEAD